MAGLLQFKRSSLEWESVLDSELWELEEVERDVLGPLWLSYYDLPSPIKQCFLYCAVFPKDYTMEKDELIELWMAQGYIKAMPTKDMEMIGVEYFKNLVMRSLFQDIEVNDFNVDLITYCKMHDMVHDFVVALVRKECLSIEANGVEDTISKEASFSGLHHLSIKLGESARLPDSFDNLRKLRTFYALRDSRISNLYALRDFSINMDALSNVMTYLRSLNLSYCGIVEIPSNISELIHLRHLLLCHNPLKELPETVWELYNLQTLNVDGCRTLRKIPKGIAKLTNLRHLYVPTFLVLPKEIERLSGLRRLNITVVNEDVFSLKNLKNLNQLSGSLSLGWLNITSYRDIEDAKQAHLIEKKHITRLDISFDFEQRKHVIPSVNLEYLTIELAEALKPSLNLEYLTVSWYLGTKSPSWLMSLTALKQLHLYNWRHCEHLPPLGKLPCLEDLLLNHFDSVRRVGAEFLGMDEMLISSSSVLPIIFPKLTTLRFNLMDEWEEWNDMGRDEQMIIMPCLTSLRISASKLKALPNFIREKTTLNLVIYSDALQQSTVT